MPTEKKPFAPELPNIHPSDELQAIREEIKIMEGRADELRAEILRMADEKESLRGDQYTAQIFPGTRETLDRKAIEEAFGEAAIAPFLKKTQFKTVKLVEN
jgi:predicted  nucleic acid-binding Zn-ribbon protein